MQLIQPSCLAIEMLIVLVTVIVKDSFLNAVDETNDGDHEDEDGHLRMVLDDRFDRREFVVQILCRTRGQHKPDIQNKANKP